MDAATSKRQKIGLVLAGISRGVRAMLGYEAGNAFTSGDPPRPFHDGVIGLIGNSPAGVVFFGGSIGGRGEKKVFVSVGRFFY